MSYDDGGDPVWTAAPGLARMAEYWGLVFGYGVVTLGLGVVLAVWPDETLTVCAVLIGIQLLIAGVMRLVMAIAAPGLTGGARTLLVVTGALALIVGLLCLRDPLQTLLVLGIIIGAWWLVSGVVDLVSAATSPGRPHRGWEVATGVVSVLAGGFLLVNPELSLGVLVVVLCIWLVMIGILAIVEGLRLRSAQRTGGLATEDTRSAR